MGATGDLALLERAVVELCSAIVEAYPPWWFGVRNHRRDQISALVRLGLADRSELEFEPEFPPYVDLIRRAGMPRVTGVVETMSETDHPELRGDHPGPPAHTFRPPPPPAAVAHVEQALAVARDQRVQPDRLVDAVSTLARTATWRTVGQVHAYRNDAGFLADRCAETVLRGERFRFALVRAGFFLSMRVLAPGTLFPRLGTQCDLDWYLPLSRGRWFARRLDAYPKDGERQPRLLMDHRSGGVGVQVGDDPLLLLHLGSGYGRDNPMVVSAGPPFGPDDPSSERV